VGRERQELAAKISKAEMKTTDLMLMILFCVIHFCSSLTYARIIKFCNKVVITTC